MKMESMNPGKILNVLGLVVSLGALPLLLGVTGCATSSRYDQSTSQESDDRATSSRVQAALTADPLYKFKGVNVDTLNGTVQLSGFVILAEQKNRAADLVRNIKGVREVVNNITVRDFAY